MLPEMFFLNVLWQATKGTWNRDLGTIQIEITSVKQDQFVKEDLIIDQISMCMIITHGKGYICDSCVVLVGSIGPVLCHFMISLFQIENPVQVCI